MRDYYKIKKTSAWDGPFRPRRSKWVSRLLWVLGAVVMVTMFLMCST